MRSLNNLLSGKKLIDLTFGVLLVLFAVMHAQSWSDEPPSVDPINFVKALDNYDVATDRPHPTGYPLFVGLGRAATLVVGKAHAYQLVNLFMLIGAGLCLYLLMRRLGRPEVGFASAALLLTHPLSLAATVVPESYISDAFFGCAIAAWIVCNAQRPKILFTGIALIFLVLGLFRVVSGVELLPLALACVYVTTDADHRQRRVFKIAACALVSIITAYVVTVMLAGGYQRYIDAVARVMGAAVAGKSIFAGAPIEAHIFMLLRLFVWLLLLSLPTLIIIVFVWWDRRKESCSPEMFKALLVALFWVLPPLALYALFYFLKPTYLLILLPPLLIMFAWGIFSFRSHGKLYGWLIVTFLVGLQLGIFYGATKSWPTPVYQISQAYFQEQDAAWAELKAAASAANGDRSLFIWIEHPSLPVYALRLIPWSGKVAFLDPHHVNNMLNIDMTTLELQRIEPKTMQWGEAEKNVANFKEFDLIFVMTTKMGRPSFKSYDATTGLKGF